MARDLSRIWNQPPQYSEPDYAESHYLPPEVAAYLEMTRSRPYLMRGILAGSLITLVGVWLILETRHRRRTDSSRLTDALPAAM